MELNKYLLYLSAIYFIFLHVDGYIIDVFPHSSGYMAPEHAMNGIVSMKADVFSFGVLLLEIVSGRKNNSCYDEERPLNLVGYVSVFYQIIYVDLETVIGSFLVLNFHFF